MPTIFSLQKLLSWNWETNEPCSWCEKEKEGITYPICAAHGVAENFLEGKGFQCQNNMRYEVKEMSDKTSR